MGLDTLLPEKEQDEQDPHNTACEAVAAVDDPDLQDIGTCRPCTWDGKTLSLVLGRNDTYGCCSFCLETQLPETKEDEQQEQRIPLLCQAADGVTSRDDDPKHPSLTQQEIGTCRPLGETLTATYFHWLKVILIIVPTLSRASAA